MHQLLDQILEADSQKEAQQHLEEASGELEEKAEAALEVLKEGLFDATAVLALPEKYRERLRTTNNDVSIMPIGSTHQRYADPRDYTV